MSTHVRVTVNHAAVNELLRSAPIVHDLERRAENVRSAAAAKAAQVSKRWAGAMAKEQRSHGEEIVFAVGWNHAQEWRGHFFEFGTVQPHHPPHPALRSSIDAARR